MKFESEQSRLGDIIGSNAYGDVILRHRTKDDIELEKYSNSTNPMPPKQHQRAILQCILVKELFREHKKVAGEEMKIINKYINDIKSSRLWSDQDYEKLFDLITEQKETIDLFRKRTAVPYRCEEVLKHHGWCKAMKLLGNIDQDEVSDLQNESECAKR